MGFFTRNFEYDGKKSKDFGIYFAHINTSPIEKLYNTRSLNTSFYKAKKEYVNYGSKWADTPLEIEVEIVSDEPLKCSPIKYKNQGSFEPAEYTIYKTKTIPLPPPLPPIVVPDVIADGRANVETQEDIRGGKSYQIEDWLFGTTEYKKLYADTDEDNNKVQTSEGNILRQYIECCFINPERIIHNGNIYGWKATCVLSSPMCKIDVKYEIPDDYLIKEPVYNPAMTLDGTKSYYCFLHHASDPMYFTENAFMWYILNEDGATMRPVIDTTNPSRYFVYEGVTLRPMTQQEMNSRASQGNSRGIYTKLGGVFKHININFVERDPRIGINRMFTIYCTDAGGQSAATSKPFSASAVPYSFSTVQEYTAMTVKGAGYRVITDSEFNVVANWDKTKDTLAYLDSNDEYHIASDEFNDFIPWVSGKNTATLFKLDTALNLIDIPIMNWSDTEDYVYPVISFTTINNVTQDEYVWSENSISEIENTINNFPYKVNKEFVIRGQNIESFFGGKATDPNNKMAFLSLPVNIGITGDKSPAVTIDCASGMITSKYNILLGYDAEPTIIVGDIYDTLIGQNFLRLSKGAALLSVTPNIIKDLTISFTALRYLV